MTELYFILYFISREKAFHQWLAFHQNTVQRFVTKKKYSLRYIGQVTFTDLRFGKMNMVYLIMSQPIMKCWSAHTTMLWQHRILAVPQWRSVWYIDYPPPFYYWDLTDVHNVLHKPLILLPGMTFTVSSVMEELLERDRQRGLGARKTFLEIQNHLLLSKQEILPPWMPKGCTRWYCELLHSIHRGNHSSLHVSSILCK